MGCLFMRHKTKLTLYWLDKADESLHSAKSELAAGRLTFAVNRLYYTMFYAVSALFVSRNQSYGKHSAVRAALHRDFIKTGLIDKQVGRLYDELFNARQQGDYAPLVEFDQEVVIEQTTDVSQALPRLRRLATQLLEGYERPKGIKHE